MTDDDYTRQEAERAAYLAQMEAEDRMPDGTPKDWFRFTPYVRYDPATGAILEHGEMAKAGVQHMIETTGWSYLMQDGSPDTHFVELATLTVLERTRCPAKLTGLNFTFLPVPCTLVVTDSTGASTRYPCTDTTAEFSAAYPDTYTITVESVPFLTGSYTVTTS